MGCKKMESLLLLQLASPNTRAGAQQCQRKTQSRFRDSRDRDTETQQDELGLLQHVEHEGDVLVDA